MMKGHTLIELTDVRTGIKTVREHHNMVTDAVERHMNAILPYDSSYVMTPLHQYGMGGIMLFESPLEESRNNILFPPENNLTGYASNDAYTGDDSKRGSRNGAESGKIDNGYRMVWNFATAQANGTISAVALTSYLGGETPLFNDSNSVFDVSKPSGITFCYDEKSHKLFSMSGTITDKSLTVHEYRLCVEEIRIDDEAGKLVEKSEKKVNMDDFDSTGVANTLNWRNPYANHGKYYYFAYVKSGSLCISRIDSETMHYDYSYGVKNTGISTPYLFSLCFVGDTMYACYGDNYLSSVINLASLDAGTGTVNWVENNMSFDHNSYYNQIIGRYDDNTILTAGGYIVLEDGSARIVKRKIGLPAGWYNSDFFHITSDGIFLQETVYNSKLVIGEMTNYLATINNLDSPVEKTANQVMKITYTITHT